MIYKHFLSYGFSYGTIVRYKKKDYIYIQGASEDILMSLKGKGKWFFVKDLKWKTFTIIYDGSKKRPTCFA